MFCPTDGAKMECQDAPQAIYGCLTCGLVLRYRSDPQRFDVLNDGDGKVGITR